MIDDHDFAFASGCWRNTATYVLAQSLIGTRFILVALEQVKLDRVLVVIGSLVVDGSDTREWCRFVEEEEHTIAWALNAD